MILAAFGGILKMVILVGHASFITEAHMDQINNL